MSRPAMLQINTAGAWRHVCEVDLNDVDAVGHVLEAGATLGHYGLQGPKVRLVQIETGYAHVLMRWHPRTSWKEA